MLRHISFKIVLHTQLFFQFWMKVSFPHDKFLLLHLATIKILKSALLIFVWDRILKQFDHIKGNWFVWFPRCQLPKNVIYQTELNGEKFQANSIGFFGFLIHYGQWLWYNSIMVSYKKLRNKNMYNIWKLS